MFVRTNQGAHIGGADAVCDEVLVALQTVVIARGAAWPADQRAAPEPVVAVLVLRAW